ncbi:MAG: toll/interleukin-1 receptor domain-containing protein [Nitrospira sp.]|nr:toll/interleukin-1 receptor domain-containing protein [Nitrospira sp.]
MSDSYVFISYSRQDRKFVEHLTAKLSEAGVQTWTDLDNISAGKDWAEQIKGGLQKATVLIYVASKNSGQSRWMEFESIKFLEKGGQVIPIIVDDEGSKNLPPPLHSIQWVDFRGPFTPALHKLLEGIRNLRGDSPVPAPRPKSKGYLFISYADEDGTFVNSLKGFLTKQGYGYWDYRDSKRNYQVDYTLELEDIIKNAAGTLSVISPEWKRSRTALQELHFSREIATPVFLLIARNPGPTLAISGMTYIDFMHDPEEGFAQLDGEMRRKGL